MYKKVILFPLLLFVLSCSKDDNTTLILEVNYGKQTGKKLV